MRGQRWPKNVEATNSAGPENTPPNESSMTFVRCRRALSTTPPPSLTHINVSNPEPG